MIQALLYMLLAIYTIVLSYSAIHAWFAAIKYLREQGLTYQNGVLFIMTLVLTALTLGPATYFLI